MICYWLSFIYKLDRHMTIRIGHGYDVHKFGGDGPIIIAGTAIEHSQGLIAHSDGDVALHALCDALLGALALGDIGRHFPDTDPTYAGADSRQLLRHVYALVKEKGYVLGNADLTIVAQAPKMSPHIDLMRQHIATDLEAQLDQVNVKATTTEKLGFAGRKEGIATHAVVLLTKRAD
jgi:2-C-methyl-D-erythritol 2,4-cyclodiphosphate synthase